MALNNNLHIFFSFSSGHHYVRRRKEKLTVALMTPIYFRLYFSRLWRRPRGVWGRKNRGKAREIWSTTFFRSCGYSIIGIIINTQPSRKRWKSRQVHKTVLRFYMSYIFYDQIYLEKVLHEFHFSNSLNFFARFSN